ncbi:hypothetical protein LC040_10880 [Bacillus tianshenii]|nr:hypothetical protein LC040_10880 [Bacillus tianshenii]
MKEELNYDHPLIKKCLIHLEIIGADEKVQQLVSNYMKELSEEMKNKK